MCVYCRPCFKVLCDKTSLIQKTAAGDYSYDYFRKVTKTNAELLIDR